MSENMPCEIVFFGLFFFHLIPFFSIIILLNVAYMGKMLHPKRDINLIIIHMKYHNKYGHISWCRGCKELLTNHLGCSLKKLSF